MVSVYSPIKKKVVMYSKIKKVDASAMGFGKYAAAKGLGISEGSEFVTDKDGVSRPSTSKDRNTATTGRTTGSR